MRTLFARISLPWNLMRILNLLIGLTMVGLAIHDKLWIGVLIGAYFMASGLFAWGCAGGNCTVPVNEERTK